LSSFATVITSKLGFLVHEIDSHHEVSIIFETMNARGKALSQFELVKNLLMYQASRSDQFSNDNALDSFSQRVTSVWHRVIQTLQSANPKGHIDEDQFLRFSWAIFPKATWFRESKRDSTSDIHKAIKENSKLEIYTTDPKEWLESFVLHLENYVENYRDIVNPQFHLDWDSFMKEKDNSIEHVLPHGDNTLEIVPKWADDFSQTEWLSYRHSLGNLSICKKGWNSSLGNKYYGYKRGTANSAPNEIVYYVSNYLGMRHIAQKWDEWNPASIKERQKELVEFAMERWPGRV
jgi:hypothetical protein